MTIRPAYIVDDSEDQRLLIKLYFKKFLPDLNLLLFHNAVAMFAKLEEPYEESAEPFVIVLDMYMPEIGGYEALLLLKQNQDPKNAWWKNVPVVLNSSMPTKEMIEKSYQAGALAFLTKSADLRPLTEILEKLRQVPGSV